MAKKKAASGATTPAKPKKEKAPATDKAPKEVLADGTKVMCSDGVERKVISRKAAQEKDLPRYFTGVPCQHGHVMERKTTTCVCVVCQREKIRARHKKKMADDPDYRKAFNEKRQARNKARKEATK